MTPCHRVIICPLQIRPHTSPSIIHRANNSPRSLKGLRPSPDHFLPSGIVVAPRSRVDIALGPEVSHPASDVASLHPEHDAVVNHRKSILVLSVTVLCTANLVKRHPCYAAVSAGIVFMARARTHSELSERVETLPSVATLT